MGLLYLLGNNGAYVPPGPASAFDDVWGWWRADNISGSSPTMQFTDLSGNGRHMVQSAGTLTAGTGVNSQPKVAATTAQLDNAGELSGWPITVVTVLLRANNQVCGFFGHQGASAHTTFYCGYETTNRNGFYHGNGTLNTTAEAGAIAAYVHRCGWGSRVSFVNGIILADMVVQSTVQTPQAVAIGSGYRRVTGDWYETLVWNRELSIAEIDEVHAYINTRYAMSVPMFSSLTPCNGGLNLGDSQASGRQARGTLDANVPSGYEGTQTDNYIWFGSPPTPGFGTAWTPYNIASNAHQLGDQGESAPTQFGPNISLGKRVVANTGSPFYLMHFARGGTFLDYNATFGYWDPFYNSVAPSDSSRQYGRALKNWWQSLQVHQAAGRWPVVLGINASLGGNDASVEASANEFEANALAFIPQLRKEMGFPNTPFYFARADGNPPGIYTYRDIVADAQEAVAAALPNCYWYNTDDATNQGDGHWDTDGVVLVGERFADLIS